MKLNVEYPQLQAENAQIEPVELPAPGATFERLLSRGAGRSGYQARSGYYVFLKNYLALKASKRFNCQIIDSDAENIGCRLEILERITPSESPPRIHALSSLIPALTSLTRTLGLGIKPFPICVTRAGTPAETDVDLDHVSRPNAAGIGVVRG